MPDLTIRVYFGPNVAYLHLPSTSQVGELVDAVGDHIGIRDTSMLRITHKGRRLTDDGRTLEECHIQDHAQLACMFGMFGGFTSDGLYFASPMEIPQLAVEAAVASGLNADNIFTPGHGWARDSRRVIEWNGSILAERGEGTFSKIEERDTSTKADAVSWDIRLDAEGSQIGGQLAVNDTNSVMLAYNEVVLYLTNTLRALSLDDVAIERFLMRYQAKLTESNYVALRFLDQATYEQLAPLAISPPPTVVTRVVMLFQNLSRADVAAWGGAQQRAQLGPRYWKDAIGFDERATDASLYRALEWRVIRST